MFIGREDELSFLEDRYHARGGQLIMVYGRRRVGKTEMLRKFCEGKPHVFYACTESTDEQQLAAFSERMLQSDLPAARYITRFTDWKQALESIPELPHRDRKLLVIDEFPYMVRGNRSIPSILQNLWDARLKDENVMIILCGSAMSFMEKEILAEKNPLFGRATGILKMRGMDFYDAVRFVPAYSPLEKIAVYAILGGIPHYLRQFDDRFSVKENICRSILMRGSILYSEVEFLMRQEFRETAVYNAIIQAVALGNTRMNDIYQKTQIEKSKLSIYLKNLIDLGILCREFSIESKPKEMAGSQRGLYRVADPFFRFWYAFIFPNLSELETGDVEGIWQHIVEPQLERYISLPFEEICRQYLRRENRRDALPFHFTKIGRWWNKQEELDIVACDAGGERFLLGECKYRNAPVGVGELEHMRQKLSFCRPGDELHYVLFSKSGFTEELVQKAGERKVKLVTAEELVEQKEI